MKLSISKIGQYEKCAYSFYLSYIRKEKIDKLPKQLEEGTEKHKIFEVVIDKAKALVLQENISKSQAIQEAIKQTKNFEKYKDDCNNFVNLSLDIEKQGGDPFPEHKEIQLYDKDLNLGGIIDRVDIEGENVLILDYKTGKEHPISDYYFQLAIYAYIYEKNFKKKVTHWGIFFSKAGLLLKEPININEIELAVAKVHYVRELIDNSIKNEDFPKQPSALCNWCVWKQSNKCDGKNTPPMIPVVIDNDTKKYV